MHYYPNARVRVFLVAAIAIQIAGCAMQPRDEVRVSVGSGPGVAEHAKAYASLYVPYAKMASIAYTDAGHLNKHDCPDFEAYPPTNDHEKQLKHWVRQLNYAGWHCQFGRIGPQRCPPGFPGECNALDGLELHVWRRFQGGCKDVVVAFRGTDPNEIGDWLSNLRWFLRSATQFDQYEQVQAHIAGVVRLAQRHGCHGARFAAVGHSLGGGLAQHAAYGHKDLRYVYAFDPSPVTGFFDFSAALREANTRGHGIDRVYEGGEILELPRAIIALFFPPSACNPRIRLVRFNTIASGPATQQHNMAALTRNMIEMPPRPGKPAPLPLGLADAAACGKVAKLGI